MDELFEVNKWGEFEQHQCKLCPWNTINGELAMLVHLQGRHQTVRKPSVLVADASGRDITDEVVMVEPVLSPQGGEALKEPAVSEDGAGEVVLTETADEVADETVVSDKGDGKKKNKKK